MRIRLEFSRGEQMKYLSHLDMMRTFGRAIRRGGVPARFTEGFNPHMKMVFGLPLQVGVTGGAEYLDVETDDGVSVAEVGERIDAVLPKGLAVTGARELKARENVMAIITHAAYEMAVGHTGREGAGECLSKTVGTFLEPGPRVVDKAPAKTVDLAPLVRSIEARGETLVMTVSAGSVNNVRPDLVLKSLNIEYNKLYGAEVGGFFKISLHRSALFVERNGILYKPIDNLICD